MSMSKFEGGWVPGPLPPLLKGRLLHSSKDPVRKKRKKRKNGTGVEGGRGVEEEEEIFYIWRQKSPEDFRRCNNGSSLYQQMVFKRSGGLLIMIDYVSIGRCKVLTLSNMIIRRRGEHWRV